jgi:hypothetical protein
VVHEDRGGAGSEGPGVEERGPLLDRLGRLATAAREDEYRGAERRGPDDDPQVAAPRVDAPAMVDPPPLPAPPLDLCAVDGDRG